MQIRIGYDIEFEVPAPTPMVLMLYVHPERTHDLHGPERMVVTPDVPVTNFIDGFGNRCARVVAPAGKIRFQADQIINDTGLADEQDFNAVQHPVQDLPPDVLPFLMGSRYCEVDKFMGLAWQMFGTVPPGWPRVKAVCDWVFENVTFGYGFANSQNTAWNIYVNRTGVCRDFMHLAVTFLRCLNVPSRYATGYLGDIGVPPNPDPMDFSAYFEVYLSGRWWPVDARHNLPRQGRVLMGRGRDATDVALTTTFGPHKLTKFVVVTDEVKPPATSPAR